MKRVNVVAALIFRTNNDGVREVFASQRGYGEFKDGWEFPGGKIELGESPEAALEREICEELAAKIKVDSLITSVEYDYPAFHLIMQCFSCSIISGKLELLEHENSAWLTKKTLHSVKWLPADLKILDKIEELL